MTEHGSGLDGRLPPSRRRAKARHRQVAGARRTTPPGEQDRPQPDLGDRAVAGPADPDGPTAGTAAPIPPQLCAGTELLGEYQDSGFTTPRYLVRRADGQVIQLSRLLYLVVCAIDGSRSRAAVARHVSGRFGNEVGVADVAYLIEGKLDPLGITSAGGTAEIAVEVPATDLLLTLKFHRVLLRQAAVERIAGVLAWLHRPAVVAPVLLSAIVADCWLFAVHGAMVPVLHTLEQPVLLLLVFALTIASTVFHEFGHASGCRYSGGHPGCIGCGIYLVWPAMYTDVTDVYRLKRGGRLRTDLGGVYFNVVFVAVLFSAYFGTGRDFFLTAVYLAHYEILEQLLPALRLDGYYILADLAGVPDLFGKVGPILRSMIPGRPVPAQVATLKRSSRVIVTGWVVTMVPLLVGEVAYALWNLPRLLATSARSLTDQLEGTYRALTEGAAASFLLGVIGCVMLLLPSVGLLYLLLRLSTRGVRAVRRAARGGRSRVCLVTAAGLCTVAALAVAWVHGMTPEPLAPRPPAVPALQPNVPASRPAVRPFEAVPPEESPSQPARPLPSRPPRAVLPPGTFPPAVAGTPTPGATAATGVGAAPTPVAPAASPTPAAPSPPGPSTPTATATATATGTATADPAPPSPSTSGTPGTPVPSPSVS
ncbi:hypothetical protein [Kitasatospora sp. NPDC088346]|uniref:hypothetical protein n=1 Tax=Kitasatospora sp. NPDC088346 TaxID=3364073 RepID=UPI0038282EC1